MKPFINNKILVAAFLLLVSMTVVFGGPSSGHIKANVNVIIEKLPIEKQEKMRNFHEVVKEYIESVAWLEEVDAGEPIPVSVQLLLIDSPSNIEDRYRCEFLMSSTDVQYYDRRIRFPFQENDQLYYDPQSVGPLTGVINFYTYLILASEFDKFRKFGGDIYYKKAQDVVALGKFVRSDFIVGWTQRDELMKRILSKEFRMFRLAKDHYFYGMYVKDENIQETRDNVRQAIDLIYQALEQKQDMEEPKQFVDAHYLEVIDLFKEDKNRNDVFQKMIKLDQEHKELYEKYLTDS